MLKREISYEDFDGNKVTDICYFNLTRTEIINLNFGYEGGLEAAVQRLIETKDAKLALAEIQNIILAAYGVKSEDGKRFIKNDQLREEFTQTPAYDALFMELLTDSGAAAIFIKGIIPKEFSEELGKTEVKNEVATILNVVEPKE
jgi:hypothetical protein